MRDSRRPLIAAVAPMMLGAVLTGFGQTSRADAPAAGQDWFRNQPTRAADTAPAAPGPAGNPGADFAQNAPPQVAPPPFAPGGNNAQQQNGGPQSDFPQDEVHDWVVASARAARARAMLHLAEDHLGETIRNVQWNFENTQEYRDAAAAEKQAYDAYTAQRQKALQSVLNDPKYQAAIQLRDEIGDRIARIRAMAKPNPVPREDLLTMASQKLQYASDAHNMEREALDHDQAVQDARQKMVQASARAAELRAAFDNSIRMNPQIAQARHNLEMARVELITAEAYYSAAAAAGAVATDYSYYRHRWDGVASPVVAGGWGPYGYAPGY
jgi:hypothetical protein